MHINDMSAEVRANYEHARLKVGWSIFFASAGLVALAFCSMYAGLADNASILSEASSGKLQDSYDALSSGYGFASFLFILAFLVFTAAAVYMSPLLCGSADERASLSGPRKESVKQDDEEQGHTLPDPTIGAQ